MTRLAQTLPRSSPSPLSLFLPLLLASKQHAAPRSNTQTETGTATAVTITVELLPFPKHNTKNYVFMFIQYQDLCSKRFKISPGGWEESCGGGADTLGSGAAAVIVSL